MVDLLDICGRLPPGLGGASGGPLPVVDDDHLDASPGPGGGRSSRGSGLFAFFLLRERLGGEAPSSEAGVKYDLTLFMVKDKSAVNE